MGRLNVQHNGKWANFSTIVDAFISEFMGLTEYGEWRRSQEEFFSPIAVRNTITLKEAAKDIRANRTSEESIEIIVDAGISVEEATDLMKEVDVELYSPKKIQQDGIEVYICPNCSEEVDEGQPSCKDNSCEIKLIWNN